jgi:Cd2+/Zn2+-exporting ATPase
MAPETIPCGTCELHAEAVFRVEGMDCNEEVVILERRLKPLVGLEALSADVIGQRLHVKYDAAKLTTSTMVDAVGDTGMRIWLEHEEPAAGATVTWRRWLVVACGLCLGLGATLQLTGAEPWAAGVLIAAAVVGGVSPARRAVNAVRSGSLDINALMTIAVLGALALGERLEAATVVFLFAVAQWLEVRTMERARQAIRQLIDLSPREALVKREGQALKVPVGQVRIGEEVIVRPGDKVPLDGVIVAGHSALNEATLTGESLPIDKSPGDQVYAGTINGHGALDVRVVRIGRDTRLARIIHLVEAAQARRAPVQTFVDRFARVYTPVVIALALALAVVPSLAGANPATWLYRSLVLLVVACPCALVISTPVSIVAALSAAARAGVLVKGGAHLERLAEVKVAAFDKTGTLTKGTLSVTDVVTYGGKTQADVLRFAGAVEARSAHPIAAAILAHAELTGVRAPGVDGFAAVPGMGVEGEVAGHRICVGDDRLLRARQVRVPELADAARLRLEGKSLVFVAVDGALVGAIALSDRPRENAREAIELLRQGGIRRVVMLTGDHADTARAVARELGIDELHYALLPEQKHTLVESLRARHGPTVMIGDGVNDAPALAAADVGVAMGAAGSDAALETADVALMSDELLKLPYAVRLARATLRNVRTNVAISLVLKATFLVMAVAGSATLWMAVLADTGASVVVVANALRLLRAR